MIINDSYWLTFVHHLKEQSLPILEEQIRANKNNHKELLKLMMLFVYTYYKQSDHATLDEKKSCQNVMRLIEGYEPQGTVDDLEEVYVLYSQLVLDIEWGVECTHWEPLGNDKTINPSIDKMKERKHALERRLEGASQIPDEQLATIDLAALARKISSSPSNNLEELYLFVRAYYYNHSSGEPAKEEEINKAYHASLYKVLHYTLKSMKEYRAYDYLLLLIDRGGDRAQQHCPLAYFHSINPDLASTVDISIDDALTLKLNKLQVRNHEFDSTMYLSFFEGSFQNEDDFKKLCADIEQFKTKFNNAIIAAQLYHSTYFRMKNSNTALTGKNVLDTINRFQKILPPVFNISNTSPQWKYYNEKLAWLQSKCEEILEKIDKNPNKEGYLTKKDLKNTSLLVDFFKEIDLQYFPKKDQSYEDYIQFTRTKSILIKIISSQPTTINAPLHHIIEQSTSINNLDLIKEFLELFRSSSKDGPTYSIQNYLDKSQNLQDVIFHYEELQRLINRLKYHGINRTEPLDQLCEHIRQNIVEKDYEIVFDGKPSDYDLILNLIHKYKGAGLELSTSTLQELKKTLDRNLSFRRYVQYSSMSSDVRCVTGQNLNQLVNRIKQHASEFKEILARLETSCSAFGFTIASPEIDNECQEMINEYFKHFINQVLASSKKNSLKITFEHFLIAVRFRQQYKLTVDFQPLFTSLFNRDRIKDITSIEDIEDFINIYIRNKSRLSVLSSHEQKLVQDFYNQLEEHINWLKNIDIDQILEEMSLLSPNHVDSKLYQRVFDLLELYKTKNNEVQLLPFEDTNKKRSCVKKELYLKIKNILKLNKEITPALTERGILPETDTFLSTLRNCEEKFSTLPELESHILKQLDYFIDNQKLVQRLIKNPDFPMKELLGFFNRYSGDNKTLGVIRYILSLSGNFPKERFVTEILTNSRKFQIFSKNIQLIDFFAFSQRPEPEYSLESIVMEQIFNEPRVRILKQHLQDVLGKNLGIGDNCITRRNFGHVTIGDKVVKLPGLIGLNLVNTRDVLNDFKYFVYLRFGILYTLFLYLEQKSNDAHKEIQIDCNHKSYHRLSTIKQYLNSPYTFENCGSAKKEIRYIPTDILNALQLKPMSNEGGTLRGHVSLLPGISIDNLFDDKGEVYFLGTKLKIHNLLNFVLDILPSQEKVNCDVENCRPFILKQCSEVLNGNLTALKGFKNVLAEVLTYLNQHQYTQYGNSLNRNAWNSYRGLVKRLCDDENKLLSFTETFNNKEIHAPVDSELIKLKYISEYENKNKQLYRSSCQSPQTNSYGASLGSKNDITKPIAPMTNLHAMGHDLTTRNHLIDYAGWHTVPDYWSCDGYNYVPVGNEVPQCINLPKQSSNDVTIINSQDIDYFSSEMEYKLACYFSPYLRKQTNLIKIVNQLLVSRTFSFETAEITEIDKKMSEFANSQSSSVLEMYNKQFLDALDSGIPDDNEKRQILVNILCAKSAEFFTTHRELLVQSDDKDVQLKLRQDKHINLQEQIEAQNAQNAQEKSEPNLYQFFSPKEQGIAAHSPSKASACSASIR